jgi:cytoskeletal protein RodZ
MLAKWTSLCLVFALMTTFCWRSTYAQSLPPATSELSPPDSTAPTTAARNDSTTPPTARNEGGSNERLKAGMAALVSDAKAGKIAPAAKSQIQPAQSNSLSKKQKIAIVAVGIVVAAVITAIIVYKDLGWDCKSHCVL